MKKCWFWIIVIGLAAITWVLSQRRNTAEHISTVEQKRAENITDHPATVDSSVQEENSSLTIRPVHPLAASLGTAAIPPERELEILLEIVEAYRRNAGSFPIAEDNRGVMKVLIGGSQQSHQGVFPRNHPRLNASGELIDGWGTPYFFHHISRHQIELRSAGPDGEFYSPDDIVVPRRTQQPNG